MTKPAHKSGQTSIKPLLITHSLLSLLVAGIIFIYFSPYTWFFLFGAFIGILNFATLSSVLRAYSEKKSVAWPLLFIVFKYAILGCIIYFLSTKDPHALKGLALGLGMIILSAPISAYVYTRQQNEN